MSLANLKTDKEIKDEVDSLGGGGALESGAYDMVIDMAYLGFASSEATSITFVFKNSDRQTHTETFWVTSGKAKGKQNFYLDKKSGEKRYLPGFSKVNHIALLAIGKEIGDLDTEEKVLNIYDFKERKETPQKKQVITELCGAKITLGIVQKVVDKTAKNDSTGEYEPTGETRNQSEVDKVFRTEDCRTVQEIRGKVEEAQFYPKWVEKNTGVTRNVAKGKQDGGSSEGLPSMDSGSSDSASGGEDTKSLFN